MSNRHHEDEVIGGAHCANDLAEENRRRVQRGEAPVEVERDAEAQRLLETAAKPDYGRSPGIAALDELRAPLPSGSSERKEYPIYSGLFKYFPHALAAVAHVSYIGNQKHNPGQPLHWSRDKSSDHLDCIARHLLEAGGIDFANGAVRHSAQLAWRALANLQIEIEKSRGITQ